MMIKREDGFSLVELMVTMVVFVFFTVAASQVFTGLLTQFKQQSRITETNIEGMIGLEVLRQDLEGAGYGLPWNGLIAYTESASNPFTLNDAPLGVPRAIVSQNDVTSYSAPNDVFNHSDYLVIKSVSVARNFTAGKYQFLFEDGTKNWWVPAWENVCRTDSYAHYPNTRVIIISPGSNETNSRTLVVSGGSFYTYSDSIPSGFRPNFDAPHNIIYGVDPETNLRMPFNRADYYIKIPSTNMPQRCADNTGVLYKATVNHSDGAFSELALLDCVADMQVIYALDNNEDGEFLDGVGTPADAYSDDITTTPLTAAEIRKRVKQVRVYILAHEGQKDPGYTFNTFNGTCTHCVEVGEFVVRDFDLETIPGYQNYHWKVYTIVATPNNLE
jgi:prepilin-type N-terminal cleavage/methylation domain-containing protein